MISLPLSPLIFFYVFNNRIHYFYYDIKDHGSDFKIKNKIKVLTSSLFILH